MAKTGLVYDPIYLKHSMTQHVETAERLAAIMEFLEQSPLVNDLVFLSPSPATEDDIQLVHSASHISLLKDFSEGGGGWLDADTYATPVSYEVALYAVGGAIRGVEAVMNGEVNTAFALVRPPGHHATPTMAMGFCLFNNIAIAARKAQRSYDLKKVLIVDFDVHHGNGTQDAFYRDGSVLYFSVHQTPLYPGTGRAEEVGNGEGKGLTVNVPLPSASGDEEYQRVFQEILAALARAFGPELILVSAGYDPHWSDPIASMRVSVAGFAGMARILKELAGELCGGRLVFALEGGYHLQALAHSVGATLAVLMDRDIPADPLGPAPGRSPDIMALLQRVKAIHGLPISKD